MSQGNIFLFLFHGIQKLKKREIITKHYLLYCYLPSEIIFTSYYKNAGDYFSQIGCNIVCAVKDILKKICRVHF